MFQSSNSSQRFSIRSTSDSSFSSLSTLSKNKYIISRISKFAAMTNKQYFKNTLEKRFKNWGISDDLEYLHISDVELIDDYGRCTFFYVKIGPHVVHILQPGSFTFNSGIEGGTKLVCHHSGCQQNGPVMGMGCASFLTKVLTALTKQYQMMCIKNQKNVNNFCPKSYKQACKKVLKEYCKEDAMEHGRFLELKKYLNQIGKKENIDVEEETEQYYYIKDIATQKNIDLEEFDVESLDISKEELEQIKNMRKKDQKYQDIDQYFQTDSEKKHAMHVDFRNTLKFFLYAKNGIWENKDIALMQLEFVFEGLERTLETDQQFTQIDDDDDRNTKQSKDDGQQDINYPRILETRPQHINQLKSQQQSQNSENEYQQYTLEINSNLEDLEEQYDFTKNEKLMEYYSRLKRGLDSKMKSALIAESEIFQFKSSNTVGVLLELSEIIPDIGIIFKAVGLILQEYQEEKLKDDLEKLASIYSNFENLPKVLARKITILKRKFIMDLDEHFIRDYFDPKFISHITKIKNKKKVQLPEALAIKDLSIIESCCISMVYTNELIPNKEQSDIIVANKIVNYYKGYQIVNQVSGRLEPKEEPEPFERVVGFIIPDDLFENPLVPKFLKRGLKDKDPEQHKLRVKNYLKKLNQCQLFDILGAIDPTNPKHQPLQELIQEVNRGKEKFCTIF